jgi:hypothetical protein
MSFVDPMCPFLGRGSSPAYCQPICLSRLWFLKVLMEFSCLPLTLSPGQWLVGHLLFHASLLKVHAEFSCLTTSLLPWAAACWKSTFPGFIHSKFRSLSLSYSLKHPIPSAACSLFIIQFFFWGSRVNPSRGLCRFIPGVVVGVLHATYSLTCCSASPKQVWCQCLAVSEPSIFSVYQGVEKFG